MHVVLIVNFNCRNSFCFSRLIRLNCAGTKWFASFKLESPNTNLVAVEVKLFAFKAALTKAVNFGRGVSGTPV